MRRLLPTVLAWLAVLILTTTVSGANRISVDAGYVHTSSDNYSSGLVYGASIREGTKRLAFGIGAHRFANSISYEKDVKSGGGTTTHRYEETFRDFFVTILVYVHFPLHKDVDRLLLGCGPQVHFLTATKQYILEKYSETVRDSRLGIQLSARYERIFPFLTLQTGPNGT